MLYSETKLTTSYPLIVMLTVCILTISIYNTIHDNDEQVISGLVLESKIRDGRLGYKPQFKINDSSSSLLAHTRV